MLDAGCWMLDVWVWERACKGLIIVAMSNKKRKAKSERRTANSEQRTAKFRNFAENSCCDLPSKFRVKDWF
jgi:hypothetical protein